MFKAVEMMLCWVAGKAPLPQQRPAPRPWSSTWVILSHAAPRLRILYLAGRHAHLSVANRIILRRKMRERPSTDTLKRRVLTRRFKHIVVEALPLERKR